MRKDTVFNFSRIEFRKNPSDAEHGVIPLGFAVSFITDDYKAVGLALNASVDSKYLDGLDDLSKGVLEKRSEIIEQEIADLLGQPIPPDDVLMQLAIRNQWSIHISAPLEQQVETDSVVDTMSLERLLERFVLTLYHQKLFDPKLTVARVSAAQVSGTEHSYSFDTPSVHPHGSTNDDRFDTWISPPKVWRMPNLEGASERLYA